MEENYGTFKIFGEQELRDYLNAFLQDIKREIESQQENYVLKVNENNYVNSLVGKAEIDKLDMKIDDLFASGTEREIPAEYHPPAFNVYGGQAYKRSVIVFHIPFIGDLILLKLCPSQRILWSTNVYIQDNCVCFEIINFENDPEQINREKQEIVNKISQQVKYLNSEIDSFNQRLKGEISQCFSAYKGKYLKKNEFLAALNVPIKKRTDLPKTFAIPPPPKRKIITVEKPKVTENGNKPEPTLDDNSYLEILQTIYDFGNEFAKYPSTYKDKHEEDLRDYILIQLQPRFNGEATAETFNKSGKTDILLKYQRSNAFIAECKIWNGEKQYLEAIDQLLGYLTWLDSKSALIIFVKNPNLTSVIEKIKKTTQKHSNYLAERGHKNKTWLNYSIHINGDPKREVRLAVVLFHIPEVKK